MNNEIKEILEQLKIRNDLYNDRDESCIVPIEYYEAHILLDYITNLQDQIDALINVKDRLLEENENNIINNLDKMFEYYFLGNLKYDQKTVNEIYMKYIKLKELKKGK